MDLKKIEGVIRSIESNLEVVKKIQEQHDSIEKIIKPIREQEERINKAYEPYMKMQQYFDKQNIEYAKLLEAEMLKEDKKLKPFGVLSIVLLLLILMSASYLPVFLPYVVGMSVVVVAIGLFLKLKFDFSVFGIANKIDLTKEKQS